MHSVFRRLVVPCIIGVGCAFVSCKRSTSDEPIRASRGADAGPPQTPDAEAPLAYDPAVVARLVNPRNLPAYTGPTGIVEGTITVVGPAAPKLRANFSRCPEAEATYGVSFREGPLPASDGPRWLADAVVVITGYSNFYIPEKEPARTLTVRGCAFDARTMTMTFGQWLEVKNEAKEFWTPVLAPHPTPVMRVLPPGGDPARLFPKEPGRYRLSDFDRPFATVDTFAFLHPLHTASTLGGGFRMAGVPTGKLTVSTMHPALADAEASAVVEVRANETTRVDLRLTHRLAVERDAGAPGPRLH